MKKILFNSLEIFALFSFIFAIALLFISDVGSAIIWTVLLPLFPVALLIIGFSNWRNICPLAYFSKISQKMNWFEKRKVPHWFEENFYYFQYSLLFIAFYMRLTILNYDNTLLALFFILLILSAFAINLIFTGKSWCNFFCPVGVVERVYSLSNAKNYMTNSACETCTACKMHCPDIDLENNYWREATDQQKSFIFYSFPGLILGFYLYFYLYAGNFDFYFSGAWTETKLSFFESGFFFAKDIPLFLAVIVTLAFFSYLSFYIFKNLEHYLGVHKLLPNTTKETLAHKIKVLSSFIAFNIFYVFAGAPAYMHYPIAYGIFYFIVVVSSSIIFYKEIFREESFFIQERFALKIVKRWNSIKPIPSNLKEIYYSYIHDNKNRNSRIRVYKKTVRDLMQEGILNKSTKLILEKLHEQIGISSQEHKYAMKSIRLKNRDLFDNSIKKSSEQRYQIKSYTKLVENAFKECHSLDDDYMKRLQKEFCISDDIHQKIVRKILHTDDSLLKNVMSLLDEIITLIEIKKSLYNDGKKEILFLMYTIENEFMYISKDLFALLFLMYKDHKDVLKILLNISKNKILNEEFELSKETLFFMDEKISTKIIAIKKHFDLKDINPTTNNNKEIIYMLLEHNSIEISSVALLNIMLVYSNTLHKINLDKFIDSNNKNTLELVSKIKKKCHKLTTYERMMYFNEVPLFQGLRFQDLESLASTSQVLKFKSGEYILKKGEIVQALFIMVEGKVETSRNEKQLYTLSDKDYFGEISLLGDIKRAATVKTISAVTTLSLSKKDFKQFLHENPKVSTKVIKAIITKLMDIQA